MPTGVLESYVKFHGVNFSGTKFQTWTKEREIPWPELHPWVVRNEARTRASSRRCSSCLDLVVRVLHFPPRFRYCPPRNITLRIQLQKFSIIFSTFLRISKNADYASHFGQPMDATLVHPAILCFWGNRLVFQTRTTENLTSLVSKLPSSVVRCAEKKENRLHL